MYSATDASFTEQYVVVVTKYNECVAQFNWLVTECGRCERHNITGCMVKCGGYERRVQEKKGIVLKHKISGQAVQYRICERYK